MYKFHIPAGDHKFADANALAAHLSAQEGTSISIPKDATADTLSPFGAYIVTQEAVPTITESQVAEEDANITHAGGVSTQGWTVRDKTTEEIAASDQVRRELMVVDPTAFALASEEFGVITLVEAEAWLQDNVLPAFIVTGITSLFTDPITLLVADQAGLDRALLRARNLREVRRLASLIEVLRALRSYTHEFVDQIFERAAAIQAEL